MGKSLSIRPLVDATWAVRAGFLLLSGILVVVAVGVVPGVRAAPGFDVLYDGWFQCSGYVLAAVLATARVAAPGTLRPVWAWVAAALSLRALGFLWAILVIRPSGSVVYPSVADACWLASGAALVVAFALLARVHLPRQSPTLVLDALLGGVTAAAVSTVLLYGTLLRLTRPGTAPEAVLTNLAYPLIDLAALILIAGLFAASQWDLPPAPLVMGVGLVALSVVDCVFLYQVSVGSFRPGTVLTPLSLAGTALVALAVWLPAVPRPRRSPEGAAGLVVPAALASVCMGVLIYSAPRVSPVFGPLLAAAGVALALVRGYLTLIVDRRVAGETIAGQQVELERFQALVAASTDFIGMADVEGRLVFLNPGGRRMVGLRPDLDVTATTVADYLTPEALEVWRTSRQAQVLTEGHWEGEATLRDHRGGAPIPVVTSTFSLPDPDTGRPWLIATVMRDISDRKAAEQQLRRFSSLVEASNDFIAIAGLDGEVQYVNPAGCAMVGLEPDTDVTDTTIADYLTEDGLRASLEIEQPAVIAAGHWEGESTLRDLRGGPPTPVAINSFLISHPDTGEPWLLATVQRDISERMAAQRELQSLADQRQVLLNHLVQAQEDERARIAEDVHDDSVQALAAVDLRLSLLHRELERRQPDLLAQLDSVRDTVRGATDRLRHLLFDLESPAQHTDLATALTEAAAYVLEDAVRWTVRGDGGHDLPTATRVTAYRIAKEAIVNVRKHADAHRVAIEVRDLDDGVEVSVVDDGRGFDPVGLGDRPGHLGLPGIRDRAAIAGGRVDIASSPDGGSTVRLWLPLGVGVAADRDHRTST